MSHRECGTPDPGGGNQAVDSDAPTFVSASLTNRVFAVDRTGSAEIPVAARAPKATAFRYLLSEDARVVITIKRRATGRRVGRRCRRRELA